MLKPTLDIVSHPSAGSVIMVEDDTVLRESVTEYLVNIGYDVTAVGTGLQFYHALAEKVFQVAIIDLGLPDMDGLQLVTYLRNNTAMRCIILTARDAVDDRVCGYDAGADLYLLKPVDCRELASALSRQFQRCTQEPPGEGTTGQWRVSRQNAVLVAPSAAVIQLTSRELDFLLSLATAPEETIARADILTALGYANDDFSHRALESLIRRLRRKIEHACGSSPILTCHGVGYRFSAPLMLN